MFKEVFRSGVIDENLEYNTGLFPLLPPYPPPYIITSVTSLFTFPMATETTDFFIGMIAWGTQALWPGWNYNTIIMNGTTGRGQYNSPIVWYERSNISYHQGELYESAGGNLWGNDLYSADLLEYKWILPTKEEIAKRIADAVNAAAGQISPGAGPSTSEEAIGVTTSEQIEYSFLRATGNVLSKAKYGNPASLERVLVDEFNNRLIRAYGSGIPIIKVYELASGAFIHDIWVSGDPEQIFAEDRNHAYVYCRNGILDLVNYLTGVVVSAYRAPLPPDTEYLGNTIGTQKYGYERRLRRLLSIVLVPFDSEGVRALRVRGYYPVPLAVGVSTPIPLVSPRKGRSIPILVRVYGDVLEPISGFAVSISVASLGVASGVTNTQGEAILHYSSASAGVSTLDTGVVVDYAPPRNTALPNLLFKSKFGVGVSLIQPEVINGMERKQALVGVDQETGYEWPPKALNSTFAGIHAVGGTAVLEAINSPSTGLVADILSTTAPTATRALTKYLELYYYSNPNYKEQAALVIERPSDVDPYQDMYISAYHYLPPNMGVLVGGFIWYDLMEIRSGGNNDDFEDGDLNITVAAEFDVDTGAAKGWYLKVGDGGKPLGYLWGNQPPSNNPSYWVEEHNYLTVPPLGVYFKAELFVHRDYGDGGRILFKVDGVTIFDRYGKTFGANPALPITRIVVSAGELLPTYPFMKVTDIEIWDGLPL